MSLNLHRRHLTSGQRAVLALEVEPFFAEEAKERQKMHGDTAPGRIKSTSGKNSLSAQGQARDQAAQATGTNGRYVSDVKKMKRDAPQVFEQVKSGELNISQAKQKIKGEHNVHFSNKTTEHITPAHIIGKVIQLFGVIDLDPCSNGGNTPNVLATYHFTEDDNGLLQSWNGRIYINPPYGRELPLWTEKGLKEYRSGNILEAIFLIPSRTDTRWFRSLREFPRCFITGRLQFVGTDDGAPFPSMAVYMGQNISAFCNIFSDIGDIYELKKEKNAKK